MHLEGIEQLVRRLEHLLDGALERLKVVLRGRRHAGQLANELFGRRANLLLRCGRLEVVQGLDVSAHALHLPRQNRAAKREPASRDPKIRRRHQRAIGDDFGFLGQRGEHSIFLCVALVFSLPQRLQLSPVLTLEPFGLRTGLDPL